MRHQAYTVPKGKQAGMVSIMVTMVMMLIITLIVLGFAQVSRRESRQALDQNLNTEAFYAAESGVNDAIDAIKAAPPGTDLEKTSCNVSGVNYLGKTLQPTLDSSGDIAYTCLLVETNSLQDIVQDVAADGSSMSLPLHPVSDQIKTLHIKWTLPTQPSDVNGCSPSVSSFPKAGGAAWTCPYGILRIDLVPTDPSFLNLGTLQSAQKTVFLYPTKAGFVGSVNYASADGSIKPMSCSVTACTVDVSGIGGSTDYGVRVMALYHGGTVTLTASNSSGSALNLKDAQAQIDVTGRAQDELKRIQVRVPLVANSDTSNYSLESAGSICKRFAVGNNVYKVPSSLRVTDNKNPMCKVF